MTEEEVEKEAKGIVRSLCQSIKLSENIIVREASGSIEIIIKASNFESELIFRPQKLAEENLRDYERIFTEEYTDLKGEEWFNLEREVSNATYEKLESLLEDFIKNLKLEEIVKANLDNALNNFNKKVKAGHEPIIRRERCLIFFKKVEELYPLWKYVSSLIKKEFTLEEIKKDLRFNELSQVVSFESKYLEQIIRESLNKRHTESRKFSPQGLAFEHACQELKLKAQSYESWKQMYQAGGKYYKELMDFEP
jgi:hypothetical protein